MSKTTGFRPVRLLMLAAIIGCWSVQLSAGDGDAKLQLTSKSDEAKTHVEKGMFDVQNVYPASAARHLKLAIDADPSFGLAKVLAASVDQSLSDDEQKMLSDEGMSQMAGASAEEVLLALAVRAIDANDIEKGAALYQALSKLVPDDAGIAYFSAQFSAPYQSAERAAATAKVAERFPDFAAAQNQLAYDSWQTGDRSTALQAVSRYLELAPDYPNAHDSYAEMMLYMGMFGESVKHYRKAVEVDDQFWQGYQGLASALAFSGDTDGARQALDMASAKAPNSNARFNMLRAKAVTYMIDDDMKGAVRALETVVKDAANDSDADRARTLAYFQLAGMAAIDGKTKEAHEYLSGASKARPKAWADYQDFMTALVHIWTDDIDAARALAEKAPEEDHLLNGAIALAEGKADVAAVSLRKTGLNSAMERIYMAKCEKAMGNENAAQALVRDIHNLHELDLFSPMDPLAHALEDL